MKKTYLLITTILAQILLITELIILSKHVQPIESIVISLCLLIFIIGSVLIYKDFYENPDLKRVLKVFRKHKHDFQNHLQIICSMVQLKKYDDITKYIFRINEDNIISKICDLNDKRLASILLEMTCSLREKDIGLILEICDTSNAKVNPSKLQRAVKKHILKLDEQKNSKAIRMVIKGSKFQITPVSDDMVI